jgi:hypothetical protein
MVNAEDKALLRARIERMLEEARDRVADSDLLSQSVGKRSDADYLLRLLAFEILLKAIHLLYVGKLTRSHTYGELFDALPSRVRSGLLKAALERMATAADYSNVPRLLATFSKNFISLRYPYEAYQDLSPVELSRLGESWIARGAPEEEATFVYHSEELFGFLFSFESHLQGWLDSDRS